MKRWMWAGLAAVVVAAAGVTLVAVPEGQEWTTDSPEALEAFQAGVDAGMKLYFEDEARLIQKAVDLDPDFVIANLFSLRYLDRESDEELIAERLATVESADLDTLTPRERFFVEHTTAYREERPDDATAILEEYLERYPNDPYIVHQKALRAWTLGDLEEAEKLNQRLVEISPNWVLAYNQLGYINMMKGRFTEAEEYFKSYRFIAPDQANPHDSLGELFITLGRYDEAEETLEKAIEIKPDFWASYQHLVLMKAYQNDLAGVNSVIERMKAASAPEQWVMPMECLEYSNRLRNARAWKQIIDEAEESECVKNMEEGFSFVTAHYAASQLGDWEMAMELEIEAANILAKVEEYGAKRDAGILRAVYLHMQGVRLALQGEYGEATEKLEAADKSINYMEAPGAMFKLFNRTVIAEVLLADGRDAEAHKLLTKVRAVNPVLVAEFEDAGLKELGLERG
jgi:tetratricopeptide (TPR) repeat protein